MRAALAPARPVGRGAARGRRIAVLGDMLELGPQRRAISIANWPSRCSRNGVDLVFCCGPLMRALWEALPPERQGAMPRPRPRSNRRCLPPSNRVTPSWSRDRSAPAWRPIVKALQSRYRREAPAATRARAFDHERLIQCFTWLSAFSDTIGPLNVLRYITFRTGGAMITALVFVFLFGPSIIDQLRLRQGKGQPIRSDGPQSHLVTKKGTPTMGGLMILFGVLVSTAAVGQSDQPLRLDRARRDAHLRRDRLLRRLPQGDASRPMPAFPASFASLIEALIAGGGLLLHRFDRPPAVRQLAHVSLLQGAGAAARLVLHRVRQRSSSSAPAMP